MKTASSRHCSQLIALVFSALLGAAVPLAQAVTDVANIPLAESGSSDVHPNLLFVLDDSGSMDWDYMPDYVNDSSPAYCRDSDNTPRQCAAGDPPYYANAFNGVYYNPSITYTPPVNADGTSKTSYNTAALWAVVKNDGYNIQDTGTRNLLTNYPERKWCTSTSCGGTCYSATDGSGNYTYPSSTLPNTTTPARNLCTVYSAPLYYVTTVEWCNSADTTTGFGTGTCQSKKTSTYKYVKYGTFSRTSIVSTTTSYPKASTRTDCAGTTCTYNEEMTNFANWYAYYHTRMQMMKTSVSLAFLNLDKAFRVGYMSINNNTTSDFLNISEFYNDSTAGITQKTNWYAKLFAANPNNSTPLRSALSTAGLLYAGKMTGATFNGSTVVDPIQYSCQQNFTILSTDGYWNTGNDSGCSSRGGAGCKMDKTSAVGQQDDIATRPEWDGATVTTTEVTPTVTVTNDTWQRDNVDRYTRTDTIRHNQSRTRPATYTRTRITYGSKGDDGCSSTRYPKYTNTYTGTSTQTETSYYTDKQDYQRLDTATYNAQQQTTTTVTETKILVNGVVTSDTFVTTYAYNPSTPNLTLVSSATGTPSTVGAVYGATGISSGVTTTDIVPTPSTAGYWSAPSTVKNCVSSSGGTSDTVTGPSTGSWSGYTATGTSTTTGSYAHTTGYPQNTDGAKTLTPISGPTVGTTTSTTNSSGGSSNSLADVAYYYYHTDLRTSPSIGAKGVDVSDNNVPAAGSVTEVDDVATWQHMTTFTLGLGVDGTLTYQSGYKTASSGDYFDIKQGNKNWPIPAADSDTAVDDLWHAAVDGRGLYFSARNPTSLAESLASTLQTIGMTIGSGAAAATSNLEPTSGESEFVYVASYRTLKWDGDIGSYGVDLSSGTVSTSPQWLVGSQLNARIASTGDSDSRSIYTYDSGASNHLKNFDWTSLTATERAYFDPTKLAQYTLWDAATKTAATGETLVNYLRGQNRNEDQDRPVDYGTYYRLYRDRENVLGDIIHAQPLYLQRPIYGYADTGYSDFVTAQDTRTGVLYVAANDGMMHAIKGTDGSELWSYVPSMVLPNLYKLAGNDYANNHIYSVDGAPSWGDVYDGSNWRTILVAGLNGGGRGYYALDITNPNAPIALWNFTSANDSNLGLTFGKPIISKNKSGQWVVMFTSGYNNGDTQSDGSANSPAGDGQGYLYVLDAVTGAQLQKIGTGEGTATNPSGLGQISNWVDSLDIDNTTQRVYGGDLYGNLWKFDIDAGTVSKMVAFGATQPITTAPELGDVSGSPVVFVGTGRYLGKTDLTNTDGQSIYAIKDLLDGSTLTNPKSVLQQQTLSLVSGTTTQRTTSTNTVDWSVVRGWYIDLPDLGERVNVDPILQLGTLTVASNVPTSGSCSPGGYSWLYQLDYRTGQFIPGATSSIAGQRMAFITVGLTSVKLPGRTVIYRTGHKNPIPEGYGMNIGSSAFEGRRVTWRELIE